MLTDNDDDVLIEETIPKVDPVDSKDNTEEEEGGEEEEEGRKEEEEDGKGEEEGEAELTGSTGCSTSAPEPGCAGLTRSTVDKAPWEDELELCVVLGIAVPVKS